MKASRIPQSILYLFLFAPLLYTSCDLFNNDEREVRIQTDKNEYLPAETVQVTVKNGLSSPVYLSLCSDAHPFYNLEVKSGNGFNLIYEPNCIGLRPAPQRIGVNQSYAFTIVLGSLPSFATAAGTYRIRIVLTADQDSERGIEDNRHTLSNTFLIVN